MVKNIAINNHLWIKFPIFAAENPIKFIIWKIT